MEGIGPAGATTRVTAGEEKKAVGRTVGSTDATIPTNEIVGNVQFVDAASREFDEGVPVPVTALVAGGTGAGAGAGGDAGGGTVPTLSGAEVVWARLMSVTSLPTVGGPKTYGHQVGGHGVVLFFVVIKRGLRLRCGRPRNARSACRLSDGWLSV